jgi:zinc/manganese transport system ATP-binding protein
MDFSLEFKDVAIERGGNLIWSEGNFCIESGTLNAIIGSNGAGKTTLVEMVLGLLQPTSGEIVVNQKKIGYVPQKYSDLVDSAIRGVDYIDLSAFSIKRKERKERVKKAIAAVHAEEFAKKRLSQMSGGQKQRIAIAAAIVDDVEMLILDEPLASLDLVSAREIVALIETLNKKFGLTILVVAHDLALLLPILTGTIYLVDGHAHYQKLDDREHTDYSDLLEHLKTQVVGGHDLATIETKVGEPGGGFAETNEQIREN